MVDVMTPDSTFEISSEWLKSYRDIVTRDNTNGRIDLTISDGTEFSLLELQFTDGAVIGRTEAGLQWRVYQDGFNRWWVSRQDDPEAALAEGWLLLVREVSDQRLKDLVARAVPVNVMVTRNGIRDSLAFVRIESDLDNDRFVGVQKDGPRWFIEQLSDGRWATHPAFT